nr:hypothetical protein [Actinomadura sp.]
MNMRESRRNAAQQGRAARGPRARWALAATGAALVVLVPGAVAAVADTGGGRADGGRADGAGRPPGHGTKLPAPPQMRALDFMLGSYKCMDTPPGGGEQIENYITTKRDIGGHYLDSAMVTPDLVVGRRVFGWNPVDRRFMSEYHDDWGVQGNSYSEGWKNGHLIFTGTVKLVKKPSPTGNAEGVEVNVKDDMVILSRNHYTNTQTTSVPGGISVQHFYDCRK